MAEPQEAVEGEGGEAAKKKGGSKLLIIIIAAVVVLGGGGFAAFKFMGGEKEGGKDDAKKEAAGPALPPRYLTLDPPFVVNFEAESAVRFLQVTVGIMTRDPETETLLKSNDPRVRNDLLMILSNQTYQQLSAAEGKETLRTRSLEAVRTVVKEMGGDPKHVEALYFTSFVMQ